MKKGSFWLKAAGAAVAVAVLGAGAALVALKAYFPEPKVRALIVDAARKQLGREIRLEGIQVGLRGLTLRGLEVSESPDFPAGTFLRVESFRLRPSWQALLKRRLVVAAVSADGLTVQIVKDKKGHFNYETLASSATAHAAPAPAAPAKAGGEPLELKVRRALVTGGTIKYVDQAAGASWTASDLDVDVSNFSPAAPFGLSASLRLRGKAGARPVDAKLIFDGTVDLARGSAEKFKADVKRLVVEAEGLKLTGSGAVARLDAPELKFDLALAASGKTLLSASGTAKQSGGAADVDVKLKTPGLDTASIAKYAPQAGIPALDIPAIDAALAGKFSADRADVRSFSASWSGGKISASGSARGLQSAKPVYEARATFGADTPELRPGQYPFLKLPPKMTVPAARLDGELELSGGDLAIKSLTAKVKEGTVTVTGAVKRLESSKPAPDVSVALRLDLPSFKMSDLPVAVSALPPSFNVPAASVDGIVALSGDDVRLDKLTIKVKEGSVSATGSVKRLSSARPTPDMAVALALDLPSFKISDLPVAVSALPPAFSVPAAKVDGAVRVTGDDVHLDKLVITASGGSVRVDGLVAKALAGAPAPDVNVSAELTLPALTDKDLLFPGVPADLRLPPSHWTAALNYSAAAVKIKSLRVQIGKNDVEVLGAVTDPAGRGAFDLIVKCRSFLLDELTSMTPQTRDLKLGGSGFFALSVTGVKEKPVFAGKLQFKGIGATVAGMPLSEFTGTASFDEKRLDVPNLTGKIADGTLKLDLTVKDFSRAPEIQLEADLDRFDLGRYLAAKEKVVAQRQAAKAAAPAPAPEGKPMTVSTRGHFSVGTLIHPNATVTGVKVGWDLRGLGADLHGLDGDAKLDVGGGKIHSVGEMATQSKLVKVLIFPLLIVQKLGSIGGIRLFPDFNNISLNLIAGDYLFSNGLMTLRRSEMDSDAARVSAAGTIDLAAEKLDLVVTAQVGGVAPIDVAVTGTFDNPKSKVNLGKFLAEPAKQLLQGLLQR